PTCRKRIHRLKNGSTALKTDPPPRKRIHRLENRPAHLHPCVFNPTRSFSPHPLVFNPTRSFSIPPTRLWHYSSIFVPKRSFMAPPAHLSPPLVYFNIHTLKSSTNN
ncbi:hypothetical protein PAXRUDRAFT_833234, partial [Paxillus rubicundulus Ve08.2h10]